MSRSIWALALLTCAAALALVLTVRKPDPAPGPDPALLARPAAAEQDTAAPLATSPRAATYYVPPSWVAEGTAGVAEPERDASDSPRGGTVATPERPRTRRKAGTPGTTASSAPWAPRTGGTPEEYLADALFRRLDANGDGRLIGDEIPTAIQSKLGGRKAITRELFVKLFQSSVQEFRTESAAAVASTGNTGEGKSKAPLPKWFQKLDADRVGQVSLYEWRASGRSVTEFQLIDTNKDGILTRHEVQAYADRVRMSATTTATTGASSRPEAKAGETAKLVAHQNDPKGVPAAKHSTQRAKSDAMFAHYAALAAGVPLKSNAQRAGGGAPATPAAPATPTPSPAPPPAPTPEREMATVAMPLDETPYWILRDEQNRAALDAHEKANVLFLGDSITDYLQDGAGAPLWDEFYLPQRMLNFGVGGARTSQVLWQVETGQVARAAPKVVVLLIGSNNLGLKGQEPEEVAAGIEKIVDEIGFQMPRTRILLLGILPRVDSGAPDPAKIEQVNNLIKDLHDGQRVFYQDIGSTFLSRDGSISKDVMPDGAHPSLYGYELYSEAVWPSLGLLMK